MDEEHKHSGYREGSYSLCFEEPWASVGRSEERPSDSLGEQGGEAQQTELQVHHS